MITAQPQLPQDIPLPAAPALPFTMKSNFAEYRQRLGVIRIVLALALTFFIWFRFGYLAGAISTVVIVATLAIMLGLLHRRKLAISADSLTFYTAFGRQKVLSWAEVGNVHVFAQYIEPGFGVMPRIIIADKQGNGFASFTSMYWNVDELNLLLATFKERNTEVVWYADYAQSAAIAKTVPQLLAYHERHPVIIALGVVGVLLVAITVFVLLTL